MLSLFTCFDESRAACACSLCDMHFGAENAT